MRLFQLCVSGSPRSARMAPPFAWSARGLLAAVVAGGCGSIATAEVTSIRGSVQSQLTESINGIPGDSVEVVKDLPGTTNEFPLVALAQLLSNAPAGAGSVAVQLADPLGVVGPNPEEFAINLALNSGESSRSYEALASGAEVRDIVFNTSEFPGRQNGNVLDFQGRVWIDGALAIFSGDAARDLSGARVKLVVRIEQSNGTSSDDDDSPSNQIPPTSGEIFNGSVLLTGNADGSATRDRAGDFGAITVTLVNLASVNPDFGALWVGVIPETFVDYEYRAEIGRPFTLTTTYEVTAENLPGESGCAAVIGTPFDTLSQVIAVTQSESAAAQMNRSIRDAREQASTPSVLCPLVATLSLGFLGFATVRRKAAARVV